jgi:hypothetical protein
MASPSEQQIVEYVRSLGLPELEGDLRVRREAAEFAGTRFAVESSRGRYTLKLYEREAVDEAQREIAGLRLGASVGLAPDMLLAIEPRRGVDGAMVLLEDVGRNTLEGVALDDALMQRWLFLLLTLHHLPPDAATMPSSTSADPLVWWQRNQPAWNACKATYAEQKSLLEGLSQLHVIAGVHLEAHKELWEGLGRPCHGNPVPARIARAGERLLFTEWGSFGLGDPAFEIARAAGVTALTGELNGPQYWRFVGQYVEGMRDLRDAALQQRVDVFASVVPLGFSFAALLLIRDQRGETRRRTLGQIARALQWVQNALGVRIGEPEELLRPLAKGT